MSKDDDTTLVITRMFDASPEQVFDAWMTRKEWQSWLGPEGVRCEIPLMEPRIGGRYRVDMHMPDGQVLPVSGSFRAIDRPNMLSFTWGADGDPARQSLVVLTFKARGDATEFTLRQTGLPDASMRDQFGKGWSSALNKLERHLSQEQPQ
jgi:uncharacterized protein YndB with AHSA1/START domain